MRALEPALPAMLAMAKSGVKGTHRLPPTAHRSPLTDHRSALTAHRSPLTAHRSLLTAHCYRRPPARYLNVKTPQPDADHTKQVDYLQSIVQWGGWAAFQVQIRRAQFTRGRTSFASTWACCLHVHFTRGRTSFASTWACCLHVHGPRTYCAHARTHKHKYTYTYILSTRTRTRTHPCE